MGTITNASIILQTGQNPKIEAVGTISRSRETREGSFNSSLSFSSSTLAVASDGGGYLSILDTHDRSVSNPNLWQVSVKEAAQFSYSIDDLTKLFPDPAFRKNLYQGGTIQSSPFLFR